jgi:hypothetical protein
MKINLDRGQQMKKLAETALLLCACAWPVFAQTGTSTKSPGKGPTMSEAQKKTPRAATSTNDMATSYELEQLERKWAKAWAIGDTSTIRDMLADDWIGIDSEDNQSTKKSYIDSSLKPNPSAPSLWEVGPTDVLVLGSVAIVQGTNLYSNGSKAGFTDVFVKRDGKWVVVRSHW